MKEQSLLLEIGVEEIPARFIPRSLKSLEEIGGSQLSEAAVAFRTIKTFATPRRLALLAEGLSPRQKDRVREAFGPPKQAAYDRDGNPTQAALGFARSQGVDPGDLVIRTREGKGEYVVAVKEEKGLPADKILPEVMKKIILGLNFPRSMRWGSGSMRFARPIHWVAAILGNKTIPFELDGLRSGRKSRGHRFLAPREFALRSAEEYTDRLREKFVIADLAERMEAIREQAGKLASAVGASSACDEELLSIVACLVEYPVCVRGKFSEMYLSLPDELLTAVMVGHQKYLPLKGSDGKLVNSFVIVSNTKAENADTVRAGAERVIRARFDDAKFYFEEDSKKRLTERVEELKGVIFQEKLGTLHDKTTRVKAAAEALAGMLCPDKTALAARAAELSKADLLSGVVREFPELQGVMGMYYARLDGEPEEVALALREQYLPAFSGDGAPATQVGTALALADRADNLASFFSIGLKPTGSEDPFALRRQALGVITILEEKELGLSIRDVMGPAIRNMSGAEQTLAEVLGFFEQRMEPLLLARGYDFDIVQSVLSRSAEVSMGALAGRLEALRRFASHGQYNKFLVAIKRVRNIIPAESLPPARQEVMAEGAESDLYRAYQSAKEAVLSRVEAGNFSGAIDGLMQLIGPITKFFDDVLVMDKDGAVRSNRLAMLKEIWSLAESVADFSKLQERA